LHGITKSLAIELASKNIRVNSVAPGFVKTDMFDSIASNFGEDYEDKLNELHPLGLGAPMDVALAVLYLISDMSRWVTGTILSVDGGFTAR
jgi:NAD(P)-dependent dehydrogenase (short-subunit alcohol dehydrogenase family)